MKFKMNKTLLICLIALGVVGVLDNADSASGTKTGNTTLFVTSTGAQTSGNSVVIDGNGNHVASGYPPLPTGTPIFIANRYGSCTWDSFHDVGPCVLLAYEAAAAAGGGAVLLPGAGEYGLATTLTEGNGTTSTISTKNAVTIVGVPQPFIRVGLSSTLGQKGTRFKWIGALHGKMARTVGPSIGLAFNGIAFDANSLADTCLEIVSGSRTRNDQISCANFIGTGANGGIILTTQQSNTGIGDNSQFGIQGVEFGLLQITTETLGTTALSLDGYPDDGSSGTGYDPTRVKFDGLLIGVPCSGSSIGIRVAFADQDNFHNTITYSTGSCDGTSKSLQFVPTTTGGGGHFPQNINFTGFTDFGQNLGFDFGSSNAGQWPLMGAGHSADNLTSNDQQIVPRDPETRYFKFSMTGQNNLPLGGRRYEGGQMIAERHFRNLLTNSTFERTSAGTSIASPASGATLADDWIVQYDGSMSAQTFTILDLASDSTGYQHPFETPKFMTVPLHHQSGGTFYNIAQRIPHSRGGAKLLAGHNATLSFWMTGAGCNVVSGAKYTQNFGTGGSPSSPVVGFTTANAVPEGAAWKRVFNPFAIQSVAGKTFGTNNDDYLEIAINLPDPGTCTLQLALPQFEEGIVDTAFETRPLVMDDLLVNRLATQQTQPSDPTGTTDTTGKMMGLAGSITLNTSNKILLILSGDISTNTTADGAKVQLSYGTGSAPTNGAAITGTQCGSRPTFTGLTGVLTVPFSVQCIVTGLNPGIAYWLDATEAAITGGTASVSNLSLSATELR